MEHDILKMVSADELRNELARREAETKEKELAELPGDKIKTGIEEKLQTELDQTYHEMFPWDTGENDLGNVLYPEWRKEREAKAKEHLRFKKAGDTRTLEQQMYPSLGVK